MAKYKCPTSAELEAMDWRELFFAAVHALMAMECRAEDAERRLEPIARKLDRAEGLTAYRGGQAKRLA